MFERWCAVRPLGSDDEAVAEAKRQAVEDRADRKARRAVKAAAEAGVTVAVGEQQRRDRKRAQADRLRAMGIGPTAEDRRAPDAVAARLSTWSAPAKYRVPALRMMQFWDADPSSDVVAMTDEVRAVSQTAGLDYVLLDERSGRDALAAIAPHALEHYDYAFHPAMKCDILRLHWLHAYGGFYCDADLVVTRDLPAIMPAPTVLWVEVRVANAFMFTSPGAPLFAHLIKRMHEALGLYFRANPSGPHDPADIISLTGPRFLRVPVNEYFRRTADDTVLFIPKSERRAFVLNGQSFLGHGPDYKNDARNWHSRSAVPPKEERTEGDVKR